ncbi:uncharacterized protein STEHIDRAFT_123854 [Stereum hirsutum FP-91666 SS1]|uniref:uncharacterized protein n=2 Tax=Stereum hirsutum (strain FP-91666) TaxID=721885 RepID=UPI0004449EBC|nr:uncharacterized protein STEHIDRAFT_123854 [Stereum hirsutum FP-91666 SS1]EIM83420.1 hypothetical protein STEHIDRAFT_123854 [Stereum hirsutum FP-91666 SS1]
MAGSGPLVMRHYVTGYLDACLEELKGWSASLPGRDRSRAGEEVAGKCTSPISFAPVTVQKPCVSVTGPVNSSENNVGACKNDHFAQAPAEVTVRSPCVMCEVTQDFVRFTSAENA